MTVEEKLKKIPTSIHSKPFHIEPGMHHLEKLMDSNDSIDEDIKDANKQGSDMKKRDRRLKELQNMGSGTNKNKDLQLNGKHA